MPARREIGHEGEAGSAPRISICRRRERAGELAASGFFDFGHIDKTLCRQNIIACGYSARRQTLACVVKTKI